MTDVESPGNGGLDLPQTATKATISFDSKDRPYWLYVMLSLIGLLVVAVIFNDDYQEAFFEIIPGMRLTLILTAGSFVVSMALGLLIGIARVSNNTIASTAAQVYIEFVRGVPMIVFIFAIALVLVPEAVHGFNALTGLEVKTRTVSFAWRGGIALCLFYAAFIAEVFRAGIQSVPTGQIEAGKAVGLSNRSIMRHITLPQAIRNTFPALGNDLIALMKDTSLVSVIAAAELTYEARIYQGSSFKVRETFFILMVIYVSLTLTLSLILRWWEDRIAIPDR